MGDKSEQKTPIGRILLQRQLVQADQLQAALIRQRRMPEIRLASHLAIQGEVDPTELLRALSEQHGVAAIDLRKAAIMTEALEEVPRDIAEQHGLLPLLNDETRMFLAMRDPRNRRVIEEIEFATGKQIAAYVALQVSLDEAITSAYDAADRGDSCYLGPDAPRRSEPGANAGMLNAPAGGSAPAVIAPPSSGARQDGHDELSHPDVTPTKAKSGTDDTSRTDGEVQASVSEAPVIPARILVVDEAAEVRELIARVLRDRGHEVLESDRGRDALQQVRDHGPDLLILEARLPEIHGFDVCRRIRGSRRYGHTPIVMISEVYRGWRFAEDVKRSYGVQSFLEKPLRVAALLSVVASLLKGPSRHGSSPDTLSESAARALAAGNEAYNRGEVDQAIAALKAGIEQDPAAFRLHYQLGLLYGKREHPFEAIQHLETATDLRPDAFVALKNLAVVYQRAGFRLKAAESWERALTHAPDDQTRAQIKERLITLL